MKKLLLLEQINQWLGVLGNTCGMEVANITNQCILRTCMPDLGRFQRKQNKPFSNPRRQLAPNAHEFEEVTSSIQA